MLHRAWWHGFRAVWSDEGFQVRLRGPKYGLEYSEGDRVVRVCAELASADIDWIIHVRTCRWLEPNHEEPISEEKCNQIKARIISALEFLGIKYALAE